MTTNNEAIIERQINDLSNVEISTDLIDRLEIQKLSDKATEIVNALNDSNNNLDELIKQGRIESFFSSISGKNDKTLANAEKSVVDSAKFNVGLSCLLVLFSKAIKQQQDLIVEQQKELKSQQDTLEKQGNDILKIQGLTQEQADKIVQLLKTDDYVKKQINDIEEELLGEVSRYKNEISQELNQTTDKFFDRSQNLESEFQNLDKKTEELTVILSKQTEHIEKLENKVSNLNKYFRWNLVATTLIIITLLLQIMRLI